MDKLTTWDFVLRCLQTGAIIFGGGYTLYEYLRFRRLSPKIQFDIDFNLYPIDNRPDDYLLDIRLIIKNRGNVRKTFPEMLVNAKTLSHKVIESGLAQKKRLKFTDELIPRHDIMDNPKDPWWVDAGVTQIFPYPVIVHKPESFIQVNAKTYYYRRGRKKDYHMASCVKPVAG